MLQRQLNTGLMSFLEFISKKTTKKRYGIMMVKKKTQREHILHNSIIFLHSKWTVVVFGQINNLQPGSDQKN
jgi:hypothetical protein